MYKKRRELDIKRKIKEKNLKRCREKKATMSKKKMKERYEKSRGYLK